MAEKRVPLEYEIADDFIGPLSSHFTQYINGDKHIFRFLGGFIFLTRAIPNFGSAPLDQIDQLSFWHNHCLPRRPRE